MYNHFFLFPFSFLFVSDKQYWFHNRIRDNIETKKMIMENNNRQQSQSIPINFFAIQLLILLIIAVQTNGSQKFVPNGRYGRRSDLPPLSSINNNPSSSYDINRFVSSLTDADAMAMNQGRLENKFLLDQLNHCSYF